MRATVERTRAAAPAASRAATDTRQADPRHYGASPDAAAHGRYRAPSEAPGPERHPRTSLRLGFVAHHVHPRGGMERVASELLVRIARVHDVVLIAEVCEIKAPGLTWIPVHAFRRPLVYGPAFARRAARAEERAGCTLTYSIGTAAAEAEVISAHFCQAAFEARCGTIRGGGDLLRRLYQRAAQFVSTAEDRRAYASSRLKKVIAVSQGVKRDLIQYYGLPDERITVVPNGVDHSVFRPAPTREAKAGLRRRLGLPEGTYLVLFLGGDWHRKGLPDAIRAVAGMQDTLLLVVGNGNVPEFREIARKCGAERQICFIPPSPTPQDYYAAADVFVFPSRYEAFSLATLEATASGLPMLTLRINGTEELVEDGVNGFFVEPTPESLREKLLVLRDDASRLRRMSAAALESSLPYTWDRVATGHLRVIESLA